MSLRRVSGVGTIVFAVVWAAIAACSDDAPDSVFEDKDAGGDDVLVPGQPVFPGADVYDGPWTDFPEAPIVDTGDGGAGTTPPNAAALFAAGTGDAAGGSSPCLLEPEIGAMVPRNWLRPRFRWAATGGANIFEIRVHAANQIHDLVVYTTSPTWTMPGDMWSSLANHSAGKDISIAIRGGVLASGAVTNVAIGSSGPWAIAPVDAPGSIVYWHIIDLNTQLANLKGFKVGDESASLALDPPVVAQKPGMTCVGCHISSPDGKYAIFSSNSFGDQTYGLGIASIEAATVGQNPDFLTDAGKNGLENHLKGISTVAPTQWNAGKHLVVASRAGELRWVNLDAADDATARGVVATTGDPHAAKVAPSLSHDGKSLVYISGSGEQDGREGDHSYDNDIYVVPFNDGAGGTAAPLSGAATTQFSEYYPSFSPDDKLVAFNRFTTASVSAYSNPAAEVFVVPGAGGTAVRLAANDPPACAGGVSPGVENSWPKWAPAKPAPVTVDGKTYYWIIFSSTRFDGSGNRQLYMSAVVVDTNGAVTSYKAVYPWNQPASEKNHTPAWDVFNIPSIPK